MEDECGKERSVVLTSASKYSRLEEAWLPSRIATCINLNLSQAISKCSSLPVTILTYNTHRHDLGPQSVAQPLCVEFVCSALRAVDLSRMLSAAG